MGENDEKIVGYEDLCIHMRPVAEAEIEIIPRKIHHMKPRERYIINQKVAEIYTLALMERNSSYQSGYYDENLASMTVKQIGVAHVFKNDYDVLIELEIYTDKIAIVEEIYWKCGCAEISNGRITKINLYWYGINYIPESVEKLTYLQSLNLGSNRFEEVPEFISRMSSLIHFDISENIIQDFPEFITQMTGLKELFIGGNYITEVPETIGNLKNLTFLQILSNEVTDIPESIGDLTELENLWAQFNKIRKIPKSITNLKKLKTLHLENNSIRRLSKEVKEFFDEMAKNGTEITLKL